MTKSEIRKMILDIRKTMADNELEAQSASIAHGLMESRYYSECDNIFIYISFPPEVDTITIIEKAWKDNKRVFVPKVVGRELIFYEIHDFKSLLRSKFGILEPVEAVHQAYESSNKVDTRKLMVLPGLAFDPFGARIGYGGGYYDRFLSKHKDDFIKIALAYNFQMQNILEIEEYDIKVDFIVTPNKMYDCR